MNARSFSGGSSMHRGGGSSFSHFGGGQSAHSFSGGGGHHSNFVQRNFSGSHHGISGGNRSSFANMNHGGVNRASFNHSGASGRNGVSHANFTTRNFSNGGLHHASHSGNFNRGNLTSGSFNHGNRGNWSGNHGNWNGGNGGNWNHGHNHGNWGNNWHNNWWGGNRGWYGYGNWGRRNFGFFGFYPWFGYGFYPFLGWGLGWPYYYGGYGGLGLYGGYGGYGGWGGYGGYGSYPYTQYAYSDAGAQQPQLPTDAAAQANQPGSSEFDGQGEEAFKAGRYDDAIRDWQHSLVDTPNNGAVVLLMAQALFAKGQYDSAANTVQMAMQMLPESEWGNVVKNYTQLYPNIQVYTDQIRAAEKARDSKPDDGAIRFLLGYHFGYLNYPKQAVRELDKALDIEPRDVGAQKLRDAFALQAGIPARAPAAPENPADGDGPAAPGATPPNPAQGSPAAPGASTAPPTPSAAPSNATPPAGETPATSPPQAPPAKPETGVPAAT